MATVVVMPKLSDTMEEGAIANWLKKEGDKVEEGEDFVEIETDKATMAYQAPASGVILKIALQPGKTVPLAAPICVIGKPGESFNLDAAPAAAKTPPPPPPKAAPQKTSAAPSAPAAPQPAPAAHSGRVKASPLARKIAEERGIDLSRVQGTGPSGRIIQKDLSGAVPGAASTPVMVSASREDRVIPVSLMRKTIAKRLLAGKNDAPHFYLTRSVNMARMNEWRARLNKDSEKTGVKISVNDLILQTVAKALRKHPGCNSSWQGDNIIEFGTVSVAMAVALPTGLVTPVIRNTDQLGIYDIAKLAKDLATKAKDGKLQNEDYAGGTFTISNLGMFGIEEFTAIINPPQAAILAVGATIQVPHVDEDGKIVVQPRMKITMSCDHRVIDGAMGAQFLQTLVQYLEDPLMMLA